MPRAITRFLIYFLLVLAGVVLFAVVSMLQKVTVPGYGAYYYSDFLRNNYTLTTGILFFVAGSVIGFFLRLNPWLASIALVAALPFVSFYEAWVYKNSHHLILLELVIYFFFSVPAIAGVYLGRYIARRRYKTKQKSTE